MAVVVGDVKPHVVCIPYPAQSHIKAMLKLAKLLHFKGFHITFVNTEFNHNRFLKSLGPNSLDGMPDFRFKTISDGLPPSDANATQDIIALCNTITRAWVICMPVHSLSSSSVLYLSLAIVGTPEDKLSIVEFQPLCVKNPPIDG
ncbi:hypothetical protein FNV43_RR14806 [Rhamnella rubrinervis]|uniref:Uncharacterized protein n=1 Tax=Rhamnella rubrinervis TaxID=2594499 RepID=A0A8K0H3S0_9ROSA|nr:hypothetical protein FNV43_RR14806 [Rhamnella rubrinervis]